MTGLVGRSLASTFAGVEPHLPVDSVRAAHTAVQGEGADGIVTFGGGAVVDCGKAVAFFTEQQAGVPGRSVLDRPTSVHVAVPTTYSPGVLSGEFTMTDLHHAHEGPGRQPHVRPERRGVRPRSHGGPRAGHRRRDRHRRLLAAAIEGVRRPVGAEAEVLAMAAAPRIAGVLPLVVDAPDDDVLRADLLESTALATRVLQRSGGPAPDRDPTGRGPDRRAAWSDLRHALPHTLARAGGPGMDRLAEAMGADDLDAAASELVERLGLPSRLAMVGVEQADIEAVARLSQALQPAVSWDEETVAEVLSAAL